MSVFILIVAAQLSATDLRDLKCVYVLEQTSIAGPTDKVDAIQNIAQWFRGRLSASQPKLNVFRYVTEHFEHRKVAFGDADMAICTKVIAEWEADQIGPLR
jgi:hypothetical protein